MAINKFNMNQDFFKNLGKRATAFVLITTMLSCFTACGKKNTDESSEIGFRVTTSDSVNESGLYSYVINVNGLVSSKYDFKNTFRDIRLAKVSESEEYGTNILNEKSSAFYRKNIKIVWPDCFSLYNSLAWLGTPNFDCKIKIDKLNEVAGNSYVVVYSSMTAKRDLNTGARILKNGQKEFKKGDNMFSISIYFDGELVGYKQTGVGSECPNVINHTIGDVDLALSTVSEYNILNKTRNVTYSELYKYQNELNNEKKDNSLKLQ